LIRTIVLDLDGTLIDGYEAIHEALAHVTQRFGCPAPTREELRRMVGHGLERLLADAVGPARADEGVRLFRDFYPSVAVEKSHLLPGVPEALHRLCADGRRLALASNKPPGFSRLILEAKGIAPLFDVIAGPDAEHPAKPAPAMLTTILLAPSARAQDTVCVGDMEIDVEFARAGGCRAIVVPGGSRSREFLAGCGADALIDDIGQLPAAVAAMD